MTRWQCPIVAAAGRRLRRRTWRLTTSFHLWWWLSCPADSSVISQPILQNKWSSPEPMNIKSLLSCLGEPLSFTTVCKYKHTLLLSNMAVQGLRGEPGMSSGQRLIHWCGRPQWVLQLHRSWKETKLAPLVVKMKQSRHIQLCKLLSRHCILHLLPHDMNSADPLETGWSTVTQNERKESRAKTSTLNFLEFPFHFISVLFFFFPQRSLGFAFVIDFFVSFLLTFFCLALQKPTKKKKRKLTANPFK